MQTYIRISGTRYEVINMTPHEVVWIPQENHKMCIRSSGQIRLTQSIEKRGLNITMVQDPDQGCMQQLGPYQDMFYFKRDYSGYLVDGVSTFELMTKAVIVSDRVAQFFETNAAPDWSKGCFFLVPDTNPGSVIRDEEGHIVGVKTFILY